MEKNKLALDVKAKNRRKIIRSVIQLIIVLILGFILIRAAFILTQYEEVDVSRDNNKGFVSLSYFGVSRGESSKYVSRENLDKQLSLLAEQGYKTITQKDIIDFYEKGKPLPDKALYLSFEDGRTDSSIFAQNILEKLNYKATMFTYANKMDTKDSKFLRPRHLKLMEKSGYWELGSNGYRLTYINVYNEQGQSLGVIDENDVPDKMMIEYYNHYLMDFIRDEYMIAAETRKEMESRIEADYQLIHDIYEANFGEVPKAYAIMHANAMYNNMEKLVEKANDQEIKKMFAMHFNLEDEAFNKRSDDIYNLSRLQVSPYWATNHLMMKIKQSSKSNVDFEIGDQKLAKKWTVTDGVAEFIDNEIILTSPPSREGKLFFNKELPQTYELTFDFNGNVVGEQSVFLSYDRKTYSYVRMMLKDNEIHIYEKLPNESEKLVERSFLKEIEWSGEDYAFNKATVYSYKDTQKGSRIDDDEYPRNLKNKRHFTIEVKEKEIKLAIDKEYTVTIPRSEKLIGNIFGFGASYSKKDTGYEQYADDIYDTYVENINVMDKQEHVIFTNEYTKWDKVKYEITTRFNRVVDYFIETF